MRRGYIQETIFFTQDKKKLYIILFQFCFERELYMCIEKTGKIYTCFVEIHIDARKWNIDASNGMVNVGSR